MKGQGVRVHIKVKNHCSTPSLTCKNSLIENIGFIATKYKFINLSQS